CPAGGIAPPTLLSATAVGATQVALSWTDVRHETGYHVLEWTGTDVATVATLDANTTSTTISGLPAGHKVWLSVQAFNDRAAAWSAWASVDLPALPLSPATAVTATAASTTEIDLQWTDAQGE